jgi:hypothetical protein
LLVLSVLAKFVWTISLYKRAGGVLIDCSSKTAEYLSVVLTGWAYFRDIPQARERALLIIHSQAIS